MHRNEHRDNPRGLADLLLPYALIDDGILLQQDGSLLAGWSYRGPDMMSAAAAEMDALSARLNSVLRLGSGWMVQCDAIRSRAPGYPEHGAFPDPVTRVIDDERRQQFMDEGAHFEIEYFLTLTYLPPLEVEERIKGWMFEGAEPAQRSGERRHKSWNASAAGWTCSRTSSASSSRPSVSKRLWIADDCGLLTRPRPTSCGISGAASAATIIPSRLPEIPCYLNELLACEDFYGGIEPRIGRKHIRVIAIDGFPKMSSPGILRELDSTAHRVPLEHSCDPDRSGRGARHARQAPKEVAFEDPRLEGSDLQDAVPARSIIHAQEMAADAEEAMGVAAAGDVQFASIQRTSFASMRIRPAVRKHAPRHEDDPESRLLLPDRNDQRGRGVARIAARRRLLERPPDPAAHAESGRHAADHVGVGRLRENPIGH